MHQSLFRSVTKKLLIIANIIVAVLFLLGCYGGMFNPQYWWPLGFVTLGAFYLLVALLLFILFWLFVKPKRSLISLIAILLAYKPISNMVPLRFAASFVKQKPANALRIMTWNVEHFDILEHKTHPEKKQQMLDIIKEYQPDVACFQEMVGSENLPKAINYIPGIMQQAGFTGYHYSYEPKFDFDGQHHFGIIIFSKYPIINKQTVGAATYDYNSTFQYADIIKGADTFRVFNIHLQSLKLNATNLKYIDNPLIKDKKDLQKTKKVAVKLKRGFLSRKRQSEAIRAEMDKSPYPVIVCGDFNDVPNSYPYNTIGKGMQNTFAAKGNGIGRTYSGISPTLRIDNIFVDEKFTVEQFTRIAKKLSDHFPIFADVKILTTQKQ
jgi:endonuclease/exonuclease/phosphatase family metal-dependent hydrolase